MSKDDQTAVATLSLCCGIVRSGWRPPAEMHTMRCRKRHGGELGDTYYLVDSGLMMDEDGTMRTREEAADELIGALKILAAVAAPVEPVVRLEPAPENSLPGWNECRMRVENTEYIEKRISEGGYGFEEDGYYANEIHKFIYEYDDSDPHRSGWFMHRLERLIEFVREEEIASRNRRIRELESLLRRAGLRLDDADFRSEISEALDHDPDKS